MPSKLDLAKLLETASQAQRSIDVQFLLGEIVNKLGGPTRLAERLTECLDDMEDGSSAKANLLTTVVKLVVGFGYVEGDDDLADEESVRAQLELELAARSNGDGR